MKRLGIAAALIGIVALFTWTVNQSFEIERNIHFLLLTRQPAEGQQAPQVEVASSVPFNWLTQDDSGRADKQGFENISAPSDHPPDVIYVDGETFSVHYARRSTMLRQYCTAEVVMKDRQIWLPEDADGREIREAVLHELMHVALYKAGGEFNHALYADVGDGEPIINPSSRILLTIMRDNPNLVDWLTSHPRINPSPTRPAPLRPAPGQQ